MGKQVPELNEWHVVKKVLKDIDENGISEFKFDIKTTNFLNDLKLVDKDNNFYSMVGSEAIEAFNKLLISHELEYVIDYKDEIVQFTKKQQETIKN
jgi:hypothetical protein